MEILPANLAKFTRGLATLPDEVLSRSGPHFALIAVGSMRRDMTRGVSPDGLPYAPLRFPRPAGGDKPLLNRGILRGAIAADWSNRGTLTLRANAPGARLMHEGGTVYPVNGKALTIPKTLEAARAGGARHFPRPLFRMGRTLAERTGKSGRPKIHYILASKVTVPARAFLGLSREARADMNDESIRMTGVVLGERLQALGGST